MEPYAKKLSEQEIWKIIAYQRNFGLRGKVYNPVSDRWEDPTVAEEKNSSQNDMEDPLKRTGMWSQYGGGGREF